MKLEAPCHFLMTCEFVRRPLMGPRGSFCEHMAHSRYICLETVLASARARMCESFIGSLCVRGSFVSHWLMYDYNIKALRGLQKAYHGRLDP